MHIPLCKCIIYTATQKYLTVWNSSIKLNLPYSSDKMGKHCFLLNLYFKVYILIHYLATEYQISIFITHHHIQVRCVKMLQRKQITLDLIRIWRSSYLYKCTVEFLYKCPKISLLCLQTHWLGIWNWTHKIHAPIPLQYRNKRHIRVLYDGFKLSIS